MAADLAVAGQEWPWLTIPAPPTAGSDEAAAAPPGIDVTKPHPARIYDYFLGGKDNFAADRETAGQVLQTWPTVRTAARENRAFLNRAVRYLAAEAGIRQFLDIGSGLPSASNVHEVAQGIAPESPGGLRGQRPDRAGARPGPADQPPAMACAPTSTRTCASRSRSSATRPPGPPLT